MRILNVVLFLCLLIFACESDPKESYKELNLLSYGVPISIMAPDSAAVKKEDWIAQQGITVSKGDDYEVQIWAGQASTTDLAALKANKLAEIKSNRLFSKIVKEDTNGFLFENKLDSTTQFYGFYHFVIQGDNEYTFQNGLRGNFTLEQAERMYESVQTKPKTK